MKKIKFILIPLILILGIFISFKYLYENTEKCFNPEDGKKLPIIMYHHIINKSGRLNKFAISPEEFENDLIYLKKEGFETISLEQLLNYVYENEPLPEKPIMITFDDGQESFYEYAYPLLKKYNMKAVMSIVGKFAQSFSENEDHNVTYSYLTWQQINELANSGYVEIGNHTYDLHYTNKGRKGVSKKKEESLEEYENFLKEDILKLQNEILSYTGYSGKVFAYPFGHFSKETKNILKNMGFKAIFTCAEVLNTLDRNNPEFLYNLGRFNRPHGVSAESFFKKVFKNL